MLFDRCYHQQTIQKNLKYSLLQRQFFFHKVKSIFFFQYLNLLKYAVDYLSKYDSSKKNLEDVLKRKILKLKNTRIEKNQLFKASKKIILELERKNLISDERYCSSKILSLSKSGKSKNFIFNYLIKKGIDKNKLIVSIKEFQENNENWELNSAKVFARKKKLLDSNDSYEKKLAKMARGGFSYEICKKILN